MLLIVIKINLNYFYNMSLAAQIKRKLYILKSNKWFVAKALKGNNVECVCCNKKFITFLPAGIAKRANAYCINCGSLERHRSLWLFLHNQTNFFKEPQVLLHSAPEQIFYKKFSTLANIQYYPVDLYPENYGYGSKTIRMDITDIKFADNFFDVVMCNHVLEHVADDQKAMREMFRVLKPGGWAILNVPIDFNRDNTFEDVTINDPKKQLELFGQPDHVRVYGKDYFDRLKNAGFAVENIDFNATFSQGDFFRYGLQHGENIFLCRKLA